MIYVQVLQVQITLENLTLCRREDQRSENCTALVQQTEAEILRIYENNANSFLSELNCATKAFVEIYSTLTSPWHIFVCQVI